MAPVTKTSRKRKRIEPFDEMEVISIQGDEAADALDSVSSSINTSVKFAYS